MGDESRRYTANSKGPNPLGVSWFLEKSLDNALRKLAKSPGPITARSGKWQVKTAREREEAMGHGIRVTAADRNASRGKVILATLAVLVTGTFVASVATADPKPWDKKELERLSYHLSSETGKIQTNLATNLELDDKTAPQYVVVQAVHNIHIRSVSLESAIRAERPHSSVHAIYRRLKAEINLAKEDTKAFPAIERQQKHIDRAGEIVAEIGEYF
jgi:hypothetical protein